MTHVLYVTFCLIHVEDEATMQKLNQSNSKLANFPSLDADRVQPANYFIIRKIKDRWRRRWDEFKFEQIRKKKLEELAGENYGKRFLQNPGKVLLLKLAADSAEVVSSA